MSKQLTVLDNVELVPVTADELIIGHAYYITTERDEETPLASLTFYRPEPNLKTGDYQRVDQELRDQNYLPGYLTVVAKDEDAKSVTVRNTQTSQEQTFLYGGEGYQYEDINNPGQPVEHQSFEDHEQEPAVADYRSHAGHSQFNHGDGLGAAESAGRQGHSDTTPRDFSRHDGDTTRDDRRGTGNEVVTDDAGPSGSTVVPTSDTHEDADAPATDPVPSTEQQAPGSEPEIPTEENTNPDAPEPTQPADEPAKSGDDADENDKVDIQPIIGGGDKTTK